jgi:multicomponent Na+:H+ antiporter subunit G
MISRASHFMGIKMWKGSVLDELSGKYDRTTHELRSEDDPNQDASKSI